MQRKITVEYYSDVLCIWAWIAQRRIDELNAQFGDLIEWRYRYADVFGDALGKVNRQWSERGNLQGFRQHVLDAAAGYEDAKVNDHVWSDVQPTTSANAHLILKAVDIVDSAQASEALALALRLAFFVDGIDIGDLQALLELVGKQGIDVNAVQASLEDGRAMAALMRDYQLAKEQSLKGSPSYVLDGGRQILYGNVGYRVLCANVEELIKQPSGEASWC